MALEMGLSRFLGSGPVGLGQFKRLCFFERKISLSAGGLLVLPVRRDEDFMLPCEVLRSGSDDGFVADSDTSSFLMGQTYILLTDE